MLNIKTNNWTPYTTLPILAFCSLFIFSPNTDARTETVPIEGVNYNVNASLSNNLRLFIGKKINVTLDSGKIMAGYVKDVGDELVHLEQLQGREYFDALIRIDSINSVDSLFRTDKR